MSQAAAAGRTAAPFAHLHVASAFSAHYGVSWPEDLVAAAARLRREHFGMTVKVNYLVNLKSGLCAEDCGYCSQALGSTSEILRYTWLKEDQALDQAADTTAPSRRAVAMACRPATPTPSTTTRAALTVPAAVISIGKNFW